MPPTPAAVAPDPEDGGQTPPPADSDRRRTTDPNAEVHRGQLRFAQRFTHRYGGLFLHAHGIGWHLWDKTRWELCRDGAPERAMERLARDAYADLGRLNSNEQRKALLQDIRTVSSANGVAGTLELAGSFHPCTIAGDLMDVRPALFNTESGTLDLTTGQIRAADPADRLTRRAGAAFNPDARLPEWDKFLTKIQPDEEMRGFLQRLFGMAMYGGVREHVLPIFTGSGANGKGVLRSAVLAAFGDYAREVDPELLMETKNPRHLTFLMELKSMRLVFASETKKNRAFDEATMKRLVGGDPIQANRMRHDPITFEPSHTLIMVTNHLPVVGGDDQAVWRRIIVVPFDVVIGEDDQDPLLADRLREPDARQAVLAWVWQGWLDYQRFGLQAPGAVVKRTDEYRSESDVVARFLDEETMRMPAAYARAGDLYSAWQKWCSDNGVDAGSAKAFSGSLLRHGLQKQTRNIGTVYIGVGLYSRDDSEQGKLI
jgi:putative DNA primase/helicase